MSNPKHETCGLCESPTRTAFPFDGTVCNNDMCKLAGTILKPGANAAIRAKVAEAEERGRSDRSTLGMYSLGEIQAMEAKEHALCRPLVAALEPVAAMADALDDADGMPSLADELYCIGTMKGTTCFRKADAYRARTALAAHRGAQKGGLG